MKAIETSYKGYRFRSRLEARWAVFFDAVGMKYEYEPEGIRIPTPYSPDPICYLPDFYLTDHDIYVEIKPRKMDPPYDHEAWREIGYKPAELSLYLKRPAVWLIVGTPGYATGFENLADWPYLIHRIFVELNGERLKHRDKRRLKACRWTDEVFCKCDQFTLSGRAVGLMDISVALAMVATTHL